MEKALNQGFVMKGPDDAAVVEVAMPPKPAPNEVLLRTLCVGICGSDIHYWHRGQCGTFVVKSPLILGHETAAIVEAVGATVRHLKPGDRVVTEPAVPCESCAYCRSGTYNLCPDIVCHATPPYHGTLTNYFLHRAAYAYKIPDDLTDEIAAMIEPLSVAVHSCVRSGVTFGSKVLITGAGPIGIFTLIAARAYGATRVVLTDINESRLELAAKLGADATIHVTPKLSEPELVDRIKAAFGGEELPNISLECSGAPACSRLVLLATKSGGVAVQVGLGPPNVELPIADAAIREVTILGAFRYKDCFPAAIELAASRKSVLSELVSHRFDFRDCVRAFETAKSGAGMKVIIKVSK